MHNLLENLNGKDDLEEPGVDGRIILKQVNMWTGFI
jgi:hypothetical protein